MVVGARFTRLAAVKCLALLVCAGLAGCLEKGRPLVAERSVLEASAGQGGVYTVRPGDTLYAIAWRFELDVDGLARANGLGAPYVLKPGQRIRLTTRRTSRDGRQTKPAVATKPTPRSPSSTATKPLRLPLARDWVWPLSAKPSREFGAGGSKGIDFTLNTSRAGVRAANGGEVVYAGSGLGGFEYLIILRHGPHLLSAYGFDGKSLVEEKQIVKAGATIADIRSRGRTKQSLHFELRRDGAPIDPRSVLR